MSEAKIFCRKLFSLVAFSFATQDPKPTSRVFLMELREFAALLSILKTSEHNEVLRSAALPPGPRLV